MHKFKVGDKLPKYTPDMTGTWDGSIVNELFYPKQSNPRIGYYVHSPSGEYGLIYEDQLELDVNFTDQELADKYRALLAQCGEVRQQMKDRGFVIQTRVSALSAWGASTNFVSPDNVRFTKSEIVTTTI